jgi:hypothetical protein
MRDGYGDVENAHKIPVMPKGVKLEHTGVTHKDMDFGDLADPRRGDAALAMIGADHEDILASASVQGALDRGISATRPEGTQSKRIQMRLKVVYRWR